MRYATKEEMKSIEKSNIEKTSESKYIKVCKYLQVTKDGKNWCYIIYNTVLNPPKKQWKRGFTTREDAEKEGLKRLDEIMNNKIDENNPDIKSFAQDYLKYYAEVRLREPTQKVYRIKLEKLIIPYIGNMKLKDIERKDIANFINALRKTNFDFFTPTINNLNVVIDVLKSVFHYAVDDGKLNYNPIRGYCIPSPEKLERPFIDKVKLYKLIDSLDEQDKVIVALGGLRGLRISEVFGLKWTDINFEDETINIQRQVQGSKLRNYLKSKSSRGVLGLHPKLLTILKNWKERPEFRHVKASKIVELYKTGNYTQRELGKMFDTSESYVSVLINKIGKRNKELCESEWLFPSRIKMKTNNLPLNNKSWDSFHFKKIVKDRDYLPKNFVFHSLRHSFGYILAKAGKPINWIQKEMRHADIGTTIKIYGHLTAMDTKAALDAFD